MSRSRPSEPLPFDYHAAPRPGHGPGRFELALGPVRLVLQDLSAALEEGLRRRFPRHEGGGAEAPASRWTVTFQADDTRETFIEPIVGESNPVLLACDGDRVRYLGYQVAGWFDTVAGRGQAVLSRGTHEPPERAVENFIRAAIAWQAATLGGALVHAASAVWNGRAYLFYGESGAGKSTLSACNRRAKVVSDDLSLVLPAGGGALHLIGSPFRGTYERGEPAVGAWPLAAGFRILQAPAAEVVPVPRLRALAELVGNLPFVADAFSRRPDLFERVDRAFRDVPLAHLRFLKDESYWDAIAGAGL